MRARRRNTELIAHFSPIAVRIPRALSSSAIACNFIAPPARISAMIDASFIACASAFTSRACDRYAASGRSLVISRPTSAPEPLKGWAVRHALRKAGSRASG
jgi:hypothetical protein